MSVERDDEMHAEGYKQGRVETIMLAIDGVLGKGIRTALPTEASLSDTLEKAADYQFLAAFCHRRAMEVAQVASNQRASIDQRAQAS